MTEPCSCPCHIYRGVKHVKPCCDKPPLGIEFGTNYKLNWNAYASGDLKRYEIERSDSGFGWAPIAAITEADFTEFIDTEARQGAQVSYRMRIVKSNGELGPWIILRPELV